MLLNVVGPSVSGVMTNQATSPDDPKFLEAKILSVNIRRVAQILKQENISLQAGLFFTPQGREQVQPHLISIPDMLASRVLSTSLRGVVMGDSITLPETSHLEGDTVIIANQVIFTGRRPTIRGDHDLHLFALNSINVQNGPETVVTIDTSGSRGKDGADGPAGRNGENGSAGYDGTNGTDGGNQTIVFASINGGILNLSAIGGDGGNGGAGGPGGNAVTNGPEARGGAGGKGGRGGNGGTGGTIVFSAPSSFHLNTMKIVSGAGDPGAIQNGMTIVARVGGGGSGGRGARGGSPAGNPGEPGAPGQPGEAVGGIAHTIADRGRKLSSGLEPGVTNEKCTEWFLKHSYVGCF